MFYLSISFLLQLSDRELERGVVAGELLVDGSIRLESGLDIGLVLGVNETVKKRMKRMKRTTKNVNALCEFIYTILSLEPPTRTRRRSPTTSLG